MSHAHFRLDWLREEKKLNPLFDGNPGVVRIDFASDDAAEDKFNHFLKEKFQNKTGNGQWLSLRLDDAWSTTFPGYDQIVAIARKLEEANVEIDWSQVQNGSGDTASGNQAGRDNIINIENSYFVNGVDVSPVGIQKLLLLVCEAMAKFVGNGGHFMLIINDMQSHNQGKFWQMIWNAGLRDAVGDRIALVYYVGPKCGREPHGDAPAPEVQFTLPHSIESDDARQDEVYDDIIEILKSHAGYSDDEASKTAGGLVASNCDSVLRLHMGLSKTIMFNNLKR
ncbi:hypothetical protein P1J78_00260 [Psychromarinibacter sp. C21-152]|uniref:Uncharacterized protein n=1 Tax=Psychromarinibacter sediminicola TaxID=3033385 RepID=A0AAE3T6D6_9RHOB|nr:hypothetical protein [Psychromarinibacter sediminicola]MDF0599150.1 hypothetical protein [Psychromarinibacter sediminicola]